MAWKNINRFKDWTIYKTKDGKRKIKFKGKIYDVKISHNTINGHFMESIYFVDDKGVYYDLMPAFFKVK